MITGSVIKPYYRRNRITGTVCLVNGNTVIEAVTVDIGNKQFLRPNIRHVIEDCLS